MRVQIVQADGPKQTLYLGRCGEHEATKITFDCKSMFESLGDGVAELLVQPPELGEVYPASTVFREHQLEWTVSDTDTAVVGNGAAELRWYGPDTLVKKSVTFRTRVSDSLNSSERLPVWHGDWVDDVMRAGAYAKRDASSAQESATSAAASAGAAAQSKATALEVGAIVQQNTDTVMSCTDVVREARETVVRRADEVAEAHKIATYVVDEVNGVYEGVNLVEAFSQEIAAFPSVWAWMQDRIERGDFSGLHVGDYVPVQLGPYYSGQAFSALVDGEGLNDIYVSETLKCRIAGIDMDRGWLTGKHHIDFASDESLLALSQNGRWTRSRMNLMPYYNGTPDGTGSPWLDSNLYLWLNSLAGEVIEAVEVDGENVLSRSTTQVDYTNSGVFYYLPEDLKAVITEKKAWLPVLYQSDKLEKTSKKNIYAKVGKLWIPSEYEVFGDWHLSANMAEVGRRYPLWENPKHRAKQYGPHWCTRSPVYNSCDKFVVVRNDRATPYANQADDIAYYPICFRIQEGGEEELAVEETPT